MKCKQGITRISEENLLAAPLLQAFNAREEMLLTNPVLATAVYLDPRLHHKNSPQQLLGSFEHDREVNILINQLFLHLKMIFAPYILETSDPCPETYQGSKEISWRPH